MARYEVADLSTNNSFGIKASADRLINISDLSNLKDIQTIIEKPYLILGGGSNLLFREHLNCTVLKTDMFGINYHSETEKHVLVTANASENWHRLVMKTLNDGYSGLENLSLIPGEVGAAPIQNIGAYGVELKDRLVEVKAYDLRDAKELHFNLDACQFGYRDSLFKRKLGRYLISSVTLKLDKQFSPILSYRPLNKLKQDSVELSPVDVANMVIKTRQEKLPDPDLLGNAGSFFKNPIVTRFEFESLKKRFPNIVGFEQGEQIKVAAGWLIDNLGLKGYRNGDAGIHKHQALVLVNYGRATGEDIYQLSQMVMDEVNSAYGIKLEREVRVLDNSSFQ